MKADDRQALSKYLLDTYDGGIRPHKKRGEAPEPCIGPINKMNRPLHGGRKRLIATTTLETLSTHVDPPMAQEAVVMARRAQVSRSAFGRWVWSLGLARAKRLGRNRLKIEILENERRTGRLHVHAESDNADFGSLKSAEGDASLSPSNLD